METARLDQLADEIISVDDPSDDLLNEFDMLYNVPRKGGVVKFWSHLYQSLHIPHSSPLPIRALEVVLVSICLVLFVALLRSHALLSTESMTFSKDKTDALLALVTLLFTGVVLLLGQLDHSPDDSDGEPILGKLALIGSLLLVCTMVCVLNYMGNYNWFSTTFMHRYVPVLFMLGTIYILCFSSGWYWVGELDCFFGAETSVLGGFTVVIGLCSPYALWGLLEFTVWWISKV